MSAPGSFGGGRYVVKRELGKGGEKLVYPVDDTTLNRECALSLLEAEIVKPEEIARLRQEAQTLAKMGAQPHVVTVHDLGDENGRPYLVCEYVRGGDLAGLLRATQGALSVVRALAITADILRGLAA